MRERERVIVFAGTREGRLLYEFCAEHAVSALFCVATDYGRETLCGTAKAETTVQVGRMDAEEMLMLFRREKPVMVVDATHPYAVEVTENIRKASEAYGQEAEGGCAAYFRVLRSLTEELEETHAGGEKKPLLEEMQQAEALYFEDMEQAAAYLETVPGNILAATGSRQLDMLCKLKNFADRIYLRILPNPDILQDCLDRGFQASHIICMQGPFSEELNAAMLRQYRIRCLLTKASGRTGGYPEKAAAARACGVQLLVIRPPGETEGVSLEEMKKIMLERLGMEKQ